MEVSSLIENWKIRTKYFSKYLSFLAGLGVIFILSGVLMTVLYLNWSEASNLNQLSTFLRNISFISFSAGSLLVIATEKISEHHEINIENYYNISENLIFLGGGYLLMFVVVELRMLTPERYQYFFEYSFVETMLASEEILNHLLGLTLVGAGSIGFIILFLFSFGLLLMICWILVLFWNNNFKFNLLEPPEIIKEDAKRLRNLLPQQD